MYLEALCAGDLKRLTALLNILPKILDSSYIQYCRLFMIKLFNFRKLCNILLLVHVSDYLFLIVQTNIC